MYKQGDKLVYPMHGVGIIEAIEKKEVLGQKLEFYIMTIVNNGMKVMIPVKNADHVGLRPIISKNEVKKVLTIISQGETEREDDYRSDNEDIKNFFSNHLLAFCNNKTLYF